MIDRTNENLKFKSNCHLLRFSNLSWRTGLKEIGLVRSHSSWSIGIINRTSGMQKGDLEWVQD